MLVSVYCPSVYSMKLMERTLLWSQGASAQAIDAFNHRIRSTRMSARYAAAWKHAITGLKSSATSGARGRGGGSRTRTNRIPHDEWMRMSEAERQEHMQRRRRHN